MSASIQKKIFTAGEGRHFGLLVGAVFLALALVSAMRNRPFLVVAVIGVVGALLSITGLAMPARLAPFYRVWMGIAAVLSRVTTPIVMAIMYFVMITPIAILRRTFGRNPLVAPGDAQGFWFTRSEGRSRSMWRQF